MNIKQYPVSESLAKRAKEMRSFSDYVPNTATNGYIRMLQEFSDAVDRLLDRHGATAEQQEAVSYYADRYSQKLAALIDKENHINTMCPSVLITGSGNFPVRKKEKQNEAYDRLMSEQGELYSPTKNYYFRKIETILTNKTIYSNDALAVEKLRDKLSDLEERHAKMKEQNAYYRKYGTMKGYEGISDEEAEKRDAKIQSALYWERQPFPSYYLSNSNAEIKRIKARIDEITKLKAEAGKPAEDKYPHVDGVEVVENAEAMRIQLIFDGKPSEEIRGILKSHGFRWSPSFGAWQRQLTENGKYATRKALEEIARIEE